MFDTVRNAFKVKDIRNRILFTFFMLIIIESVRSYRFRVLTGMCLQTGLLIRVVMRLTFSMQ